MSHYLFTYSTHAGRETKAIGASKSYVEHMRKQIRKDGVMFPSAVALLNGTGSINVEHNMKTPVYIPTKFIVSHEDYVEEVVEPKVEKVITLPRLEAEWGEGHVQPVTVVSSEQPYRVISVLKKDQEAGKEAFIRVFHDGIEQDGEEKIELDDIKVNEKGQIKANKASESPLKQKREKSVRREKKLTESDILDKREKKLKQSVAFDDPYGAQEEKKQSRLRQSDMPTGFERAERKRERSQRRDQRREEKSQRREKSRMRDNVKSLEKKFKVSRGRDFGEEE